MQCPLCQADNPPTADHCSKCSTPLPLADVTISPTGVGGSVIGRTEAWSVAVTPRPSSEAASKGQLEPGTVLAERFEILQLLGQGGMGAVYKGRDMELDRLVALKLIRPELASHPEILRRFKQELILAREVTHRNVIRIFDLGQAHGIKFITMEYVEGRDLRTLIHEKQKMASEEAVPIVVQICAALDAAHNAGVVHRDLKPQNVMLDKDGRVYVMDFGIARSLETPGMTQTGALMGTPEYMSPEQAKGEKVDARSDLFALGIIFYEMLTGISPFKADTAMAMMFKRTQERATPLVQLNMGVPGAISDIVAKCLETKPDERYQTARAIVDDLELWKDGAPRGTIVPTSRRIRYVPSYQKWLVVGGAVAVLAVGVYVFRDNFSLRPTVKSAAAAQPISLAILPFRNASADPSIDYIGSSLADGLSTDVGQSAHLRTISSDRVRQALTDLHVPANADFSPDTLRQLADSSSADILVWGRYAKLGDKINIDATVEDIQHNRRAPLKIEAANEKDLPGIVDQLADSVRKNMGLGSSAIQELKAAAYRPTSNSMEAVRDFTLGLESTRQGNQMEAVKQFEAATKADPNFALAYSWLGQTYARLGHDQQAEQAGSRAVDLSANLSPVEKYMIQAANARIGNNYPKALENLGKLVQLMPNDPQIQYQMGELYASMGTYDKAQEHYQASLASDPKQLNALTGLGEVETELGKPENAIDHLNSALSLAVKLDNKQGKANVDHDLGEAYSVLNRPADALQNFERSFLVNQELGDKKGMAASLDQIAVTYGAMGKTSDAEKKYKEELALRKDIGDQDGLGLALVNYGTLLFQNGRYDDALTTTKQALQIEMQMGNESRQGLCLMNIGLIYFQMAKYDDALMYQQRAVDQFQKLKKPSELAQNWNNLGLTYASIGQLDKALANYVLALDQARKIGDKLAVSATLDDMAALYLVQGRYGEALKTQQEAVDNAQQLQEQSGPYLAETRADYANVLNRMGRSSEAEKILDDSLKIALSTQSESLAAKTLNFQGESFYFRGDPKSARPLFERAERSAAKAKDRMQSLDARLNLARVSVQDGHPAAAAALSGSLVKEAGELGLKYTATDASILLGEALLASKDYGHARQALESALRKTEDLGMIALQPRAHYLLSQALRNTGNKDDAEMHLKKAAALVEQMRRESNSDALLERVDLKPIVAEARK
jgi:serine/threonine protein kinase/tetratricopeptide (TPR) repeat protein